MLGAVGSVPPSLGMELDSFEYRDPGRVVADVAAHHRLVDGDALLALVHDPPGRQDVVHVSRVATTEWAGLDRFARSQLLHDATNALPIPDRSTRGGPQHSIMTIVARRGIAVIGPAEAEWLAAWHYSNHLTGAYAGDLLLVTEHGWVDWVTGWGGNEPRIASPMASAAG